MNSNSFAKAPRRNITPDQLDALRDGQDLDGFRYVPVCQYGRGLRPLENEVGAVMKVGRKATPVDEVPGLYTFDIVAVRERLFE